MNFFTAQILSLVFYVITLAVYYRARREYIGGKIGAAVQLIIIALVLLLLSDFTDYFLGRLLTLGKDSMLIIRIILKLTAMGVLFFGGLRFFTRRPAPQTAEVDSSETAKAPQPQTAPDAGQTIHQAEAPAPRTTIQVDPHIPETRPTLGRYEILEIIGRGAMGIVYRALDPKLNRLTAIKTLRFSDNLSEAGLEEMRAHFYREAEVIARLSHPNIVSIYDVGEDFDLSYIAMEYLQGESLEFFTRKDHLLPVSACIEIVRQVCEALDYAHRHDIVHRDIKPANIMLLPDGTVKVTDFGVARVMVSSLTHTGTIKGTPYYMSPEQAMGEKVTGASDIFSLGVVFYELLTGRTPFGGNTLSAIMYQITKRDPIPIDRDDGAIDPAVRAVVSRALEKDLTQRYANAREMAEALVALQQTLGTVKNPPAPAALDAASAAAALRPKAVDSDSVQPPVPADMPPLAMETKSGAGTEVEEPAGGLLQAVAGDDPSDGGADPEKPAPRWPAPDETAGADVRPGCRALLQAVMERLSPILRQPVKIRLIAAAVGIALLGGSYIMWSLLKGSDSSIPTEKPAVFMDHRLAARELLAKAQAEKAAPGASAKGSSEPPPAAVPRSAPSLLQNAPSSSQGETTPQKDTPRPDSASETVPATAAAPSEDPSPGGSESEWLQEVKIRKENATPLPKTPPSSDFHTRRTDEAADKAARQAEAAEKRRIALARQRAEAEKRRTAAVIERELSEARVFLQQKQYQTAEERFRQALAAVENSPFKQTPQFFDYQQRIHAALNSDEIVYGAEGYVHYQGQWLEPAAYTAALYRDGYVLYRGEMVAHQKLKPLIADVAYPVVRRMLNEKFAGQTVHREEIKPRRVDLIENAPQGATFNTVFSWEVWTFKDISKDEYCVKVRYHADNDQWEALDRCR